MDMSVSIKSGTEATQSEAEPPRTEKLPNASDLDERMAKGIGEASLPLVAPCVGDAAVQADR